MTTKTHGGYRSGAGRKALFRHKTQKFSAKVAPVTIAAVEACQARLTARARRADPEAEPISVSDAVEYLIRRGSRTKMDR